MKLRTTWKTSIPQENVNLSPNMRVALRGALDREGLCTGKVSILKALNMRSLCESNGQLTPKGHLYGLSQCSLNKQCESLGIAIETLRVGRKKGQPELLVLDHYAKSGYEGCFTEGGIVFIILYSLCFDRLYRLGVEKWGGSNYRVFVRGKEVSPVQSWMYGGIMIYQYFLEAQPDLEELMLDDIQTTSKDKMLKHFEIIRSWQRSDTWWPHKYVGVTSDIVGRTYSYLGKTTLHKIAAAFFSDPYSYVKGWPDLTIIKAKGVRFVEVKTTDTLHLSQLITIPDVLLNAGLNVSITRLSST